MTATFLFWRRLAQGLALTLMLGACGGEQTAPAQLASSVSLDELAGREFVLERSEGFQAIAGSIVRFTFGSGWLSFHSGCNYQAGPIEFRDGVLMMTVDSTTDALCRSHQEQDDWLARFLESQPRISFEDDRLTLQNKQAKLSFVDGELAEPDQSLAGLPWTLGEFMVDSRPSPVPTPVRPKVTFFADGSLRILSGCNTASGRWALSSPGAVSLIVDGFTEEGCSPPQSFADEHVRAILRDGEVSFSIDGDRLTLRRDNLSMVGVREGTQAAPNELDFARLDGMQFLLERAEGFTPVPDTRVHLGFHGRELGISAGCNSQQGPYRVDAGRLIVEGLSSNLIGCFGPRGEQDTWLASFFASHPRITRDADRLTLTGESATLVFLDRELADPDQPLAGPAWIMDTQIMNDAVSTGSSGAGMKDVWPTLTFRDDGIVEIFTTCGTGRANYTSSADEIVFSNVAYEEQGCSAPNALHTLVKQVIADGLASFEIEARSLTIMRGQVGLAGRRE
jgi:heat shock protein HslJ